MITPRMFAVSGEKTREIPVATINAQNTAPMIFNIFTLNHPILSLACTDKPDFYRESWKSMAPTKSRPILC